MPISPGTTWTVGGKIQLSASMPTQTTLLERNQLTLSTLICNKKVPSKNGRLAAISMQISRTTTGLALTLSLLLLRIGTRDLYRIGLRILTHSLCLCFHSRLIYLGSTCQSAIFRLR
jgi:hypothetical protein